jgi:hypothetical protein
LLLQRGDGLRQRRLGHVQARGGAAEMLFFGDGGEVAQLAQPGGDGRAWTDIGSE